MGVVLTFLLNLADFVCFAFNAANMRFTTPENNVKKNIFTCENITIAMVLKKIFHEWAQRTREIFYNTRREISYLRAAM